MPDHIDSVSIDLGENQKLVGDYIPGKLDPDIVLLWVHGFGSHRGGEKALAVREECIQRGWNFAAFDFRGHGESTGIMHDLKASRLLADLEAVRLWLSDRGHKRLAIVASSMGAFAAAWFAVRHPDAVVGTVLLAPAFNFLELRWQRLTEAEREQWRRTDRLRVANEWVETELGYACMEERDQFRAVDLAADWQTPALLIHGVGDDVVPHSDSLTFLHLTSYPNVELRLLKAGDHRLTAFKDVIAGEAGRFFERLLGVRKE